MTHDTHAGRWIWMLVLLSLTIQTHGRTHQPEFSTAGFYALKETGRTAYSMNPAWRVHREPNKTISTTGIGDSSHYPTVLNISLRKPADV